MSSRSPITNVNLMGPAAASGGRSASSRSTSDAGEPQPRERSASAARTRAIAGALRSADIERNVSTASAVAVRASWTTSRTASSARRPSGLPDVPFSQRPPSSRLTRAPLTGSRTVLELTLAQHTSNAFTSERYPPSTTATIQTNLSIFTRTTRCPPPRLAVSREKVLAMCPPRARRASTCRLPGLC